MTIVEKDIVPISKTDELQALAKKHLLMHFTSATYYESAPLTIMSRGEGCWVWDEFGNRYLDGLAGLYCVNVGYSHGEEIGEAIKAQMCKLPYFSNWSFAHEPSIRLAAKVASLAPPSMNRVFFTSSGSESNESAMKLIRQYHLARGDHAKTKFIARRVSYHGTSFGALSLNGMTNIRNIFEPLIPGVRHVSNTKRYKRPQDESEAQFTAFLLNEIESLIIQEGPDTVAGLFIEPLQNAGGSLTPPAGYADGIRHLCDKYGVLLVADEVICGFGRLGEWFGSIRYGIKPDIITFAKGIASGYIPLGGMITSDAVMEPILNGPQQMFLHGLTYGGHPAACAAALANIEIMEREGVLNNVRRNQAYFRAKLEELKAHAIVGDVRGDGYHYSLELVTDKANRSWTSAVPSTEFVATRLAPALFKSGLLCRAAVDHEGTPLIQVSPPLILSLEEIDWLVARLDVVLGQQIEIGFD
ncbi:aspartate aminotransferase family protein [Pseudomonas frederiksbergensis]|jgi:adenosylmethionine-8-amino-7-oxononanoate aminotransferase|uniref:aspartate aminotransferase family protein n=1 Tax=Pseudomonas TaxID=286 RepID=UPI0013A09F48|nr:MULTISPECIES: aspartate aminotransferase family protein [Pseudomonas]QIB03775.1 aspartate aminotransferase family protein [Pseudomonas fluorescens]URM25768.1 aspartate aminotransferase family protein [Pseudomonas frederiksbergensis]WLG70312.1 aspartate aminotransferase family protein [Pseudomonas brassicacearum]WLI15186.1 aspartate aminotransferase family protein [Pseudomonas sp. FP603]WNZ76523.1 aspartate aminotransferase family protein [Pseudomonas sp. P105]